jgi:hypothetical protein
MLHRSLGIATALALLAVASTQPTQAQPLLDAATIRAGLRTADPNQETYIAYVVALRDHGQLPDRLLTSTFLWARRKPFAFGGVKFEYFKHALITQAAKLGITLPTGTPALEPTINGRVVLRVLLVDVPCPNCTVTLRENGADATTARRTVTNGKGHFSFANVPYGVYTLTAEGPVLLLRRRGAAEVTLPTPPPSSDTVSVQITVK